MLQFMESQRVGHDAATELTESARLVNYREHGSVANLGNKFIFLWAQERSVLLKGLQIGFPSPFEDVSPWKSGLQCFDSTSHMSFACEDPA